jgi:hypothetical protein
MRRLILSLFAIAALYSAQPGKQTFTGIITDSMCARADHSRMQMGPTDAQCTIACISEHDATYILYDGKEAFNLSDQKKPERFAGQKVTVTGTLDAKTKTIQLDSISAAK